MTNPLPIAVQHEYPFVPRSISLDGHRYSYVDEGSGPVILFVHGNPTWSFAWRHLIRALSPEYRCLAVDHLGMGLSEKPQDYGYTIDQHISNLCRFIQERDLKEITLVGHDWGGCIGMGAAGRLPDRFRRFVMMNTAAFRSTRIPLRISVCRIPVLGPLAVRGANAFARAAITMAMGSTTMSQAARQGYLFPYDSWKNRIAVQRFVEEIPLRSSHPTYKTLVEVETGLDQFRDHPWHFFWGNRDWCFTTDFLDEWKRRFPQARSVQFSEAGHYLFEEEPQGILPHLQEFLKLPN